MKLNRTYILCKRTYLLKGEFTGVENESSFPETIINAAELAISRAQGQQQGL
jgi:hypothetical protein